MICLEASNGGGLSNNMEVNKIHDYRSYCY